MTDTLRPRDASVSTDAYRDLDPLPAAECSGTESLGYQPALDGLRAVAVAAVLCFHAGFPWAVGGFLGVSTFFTLSGFLITSVLLNEHTRRGAVSLRRFWGRRFRRLMPAALLTLVFVLVYAHFAAPPAQLVGLRGDMLSALGYVENWHLILQGRSYADLFQLPSPVEHFWSLAIEEQFYVVFPLIVAGALALRRSFGAARPGGGRSTSHRRSTLAVVFSVLLAASLVSLWLLQGDDTRIYYGTDTRAAELLIGALLAVAISGRTTVKAGFRRIAIVTLGAIGLLVSVIIWWRVPLSTAFLYRGGFALYAIVSATVLYGALQPGALRSVLGTRTLVAIGKISYGVYLLHWPVFLWLDPARTGLGPWPNFTLQVAVTLALATASYHLLEQPVRLRRWPRRARDALTVAPAAFLAVGLGIVMVTASPAKPAITFSEAAGLVHAPVTTTTTVPGQLVPPAPLRVVLAGDSMANTLGAGFRNWAVPAGLAQVFDATKIGCGIGNGVPIRALGIYRPTDPACLPLPDHWREGVATLHPDVSVVLSCLWDVADHQLPGSRLRRSVGDPVFDQWMLGRMNETVDQLGGGGTNTVAWLTCPHLNPTYVRALYMGPPPYAEADPARVDRLNQLIVTMAAQHPNVVVVDLAGYLAALPGGDLNPQLRPDGVHFTLNSAIDVVRDFVFPELWAAMPPERRAVTIAAASSTTSTTTASPTAATGVPAGP